MIFSISGRTKLTNDQNVILNNTLIERVDNYTFLGMNINENLNWKNHMLNILSKIQRNLGIVRKTARFLNRNSLIQLYHSLIMSHIRKGIIVWHHSNINLKKKIQACANKFLRIIFFLKPRDSVREIMKENNLLSVNQIYFVELAKLMHKHALGTLPPPLTRIFLGQTRQTQMVSRAATQIVQPPSRFSKCEQAVRCTGPKIWNSIPNNIKYHTEIVNGIVINKPIKLNSFIFNVKKYALSSVDFS